MKVSAILKRERVEPVAPHRREIVRKEWPSESHLTWGEAHSV